jgi:hypothetical protein
MGQIRGEGWKDEKKEKRMRMRMRKRSLGWKGGMGWGRIG